VTPSKHNSNFAVAFPLLMCLIVMGRLLGGDKLDGIRMIDKFQLFMGGVMFGVFLSALSQRFKGKSE